jgi:hypothetical protein
MPSPLVSPMVLYDAELSSNFKWSNRGVPPQPNNLSDITAPDRDCGSIILHQALHKLCMSESFSKLHFSPFFTW